MKREEAIGILSARSRILKNSKKTGKQRASEALDMAIEALRQPKRPIGRWIPDHHKYPIRDEFCCSECGLHVCGVRTKFCCCCGADMGG